MRFLRRGASESGLDARLARFWDWWAGAKDTIASEIQMGRVAERAGEISIAVNAIDRRLAWELAKGSTSTHMLVVTPEGSAEVRPIALAWLESAPGPDPTWEYHASRQPGPLGIISVAHAEVALAEVRAITSWDENRERLAVRLWHPTFDSLSDSVRTQVSFLFLDTLLGEDDVERWVGSVDVDSSAQAGRTPDELTAEVHRRAGSATGNTWVVAEGTDAHGGPTVLRLHLSAKQLDHPYARQHLEVDIEGGLDTVSDRDRSDATSAAERELVTDLEGVAIEMAHIAEHRRRVTHFVCEDGDKAVLIARGWAARHRDLKVRLRVEADPTWSFRRAHGG